MAWLFQRFKEAVTIVSLALLLLALVFVVPKMYADFVYPYRGIAKAAQRFEQRVWLVEDGISNKSDMMVTISTAGPPERHRLLVFPERRKYFTSLKKGDRIYLIFDKTTPLRGHPKHLLHFLRPQNISARASCVFPGQNL